MLRHAIAPSRRFTKASHDVVRHPRLGSDAKILLLYVQGLPEDRAGRALSEHAGRLGITGRAYQKAKKQLVEHGFVHERRRQAGRGHWATDQLCSNVPLTEEEARRVQEGPVVAHAPQPSAQERTVGRPGARPVGDSPPVEEEREKNCPHPPSEAEPEVEPDSAPDPELSVSGRLLLSLRHAAPQLHLGVREAQGLAELAAEWIRRGITTTDLRRALTSELPPDGVRSAVGFLRHRLVQKLPEPPAPTAAHAAAPSRVRELVPCAGPGEDHVFRAVGDETHCAPCRQEEARAFWAAHAAAYAEQPPHVPWRERVAALAVNSAEST
ncbi:hypothetical protein [Streptomyces sp. NBC_01217]|uniref:hypothetical protein n=1 Tax=Streptomyces sp. NBC_01217 TaxID=2903779 RepID=UPI002E13D63A|nr:hypothetical protein OG507_23300 [Streptomyces sp. NBC_01217]